MISYAIISPIHNNIVTFLVRKGVYHMVKLTSESLKKKNNIFNLKIA